MRCTSPTYSAGIQWALSSHFSEWKLKIYMNKIFCQYSKCPSHQTYTVHPSLRHYLQQIWLLNLLLNIILWFQINNKILLETNYCFRLSVKVRLHEHLFSYFFPVTPYRFLLTVFSSISRLDDYLVINFLLLF